MTLEQEDWLVGFLREFSKEGDRASAIVAGAMLDDALARSIAARLVPAPNKDRDFLNGPLATFSSRIDTAYQLGLVSEFLHRDLHLIRKIRNDAAHAHRDFSFDEPKTRDRVRALERASDYNKRNPSTREGMGPPGPRWDFLGIVGWILVSLDLERSEVSRLRPKGPEFGYIDWDALPDEVKRILRKGYV